MLYDLPGQVKKEGAVTATMKVTVTGGGGFIGQHLCLRLAASGMRVRTIQRTPSNVVPSAIKTIQGDVRDYSTLIQAFRGSDVIYHLAGIPPGAGNRKLLLDVNVLGTRNVLSAAMACDVHRVVFLSSSEVYGPLPRIPCPEESPLRPLTAYGRSKKLAEEWCHRFTKRHGLEVIILRPSAVVGPGVEVPTILFLFEKILRNRPLFFLGKGRNRIQLLSIHDLVDALTAALAIPCPNAPINIAALVGTPLRDLAEGLRRHAGARSPIVPIPSAPFKPLLRLLEGLAIWPSLLPYIRRSDEDFILDITRAANILGFAPRYSNLEALVEAYEWYRKQRN